MNLVLLLACTSLELEALVASLAEEVGSVEDPAGCTDSFQDYYSVAQKAEGVP